MKPDMKTALTLTRCLNLYWYNVSYSEAIGLLFPNSDPVYRQEKIAGRPRGLTDFMGTLDINNQTKYIQLAMDKYWDEAEQWANFSIVK